MEPKETLLIKDKARILITEKCNRNCSGCCNTYERIMKSAQYLDTLTELPKDLKEIMITGGEPMLFPQKTERITKELRKIYPQAKIYLYSSLYNKNLENIISLLDGFQYTIHEGAIERDLLLLDNLQELLKEHRQDWKEKSFRLYIDDRVDLPVRIMPHIWDRATISTWLTEEELLDLQPDGLPKGEALYIYTGE